MVNKIFDFKLYKEGIKQLRLIGFFSFAVVLLAAILTPVSDILSARYYYSVEDYTKIVSLYDSHPLLLVSFMILAPVMTLYLFHFLNKRSSSDFYHSMPHTRITLFVNFFLAIASWITAILFISSAVNIAIMNFYPQIFVINWSNSLAALFNCWAASILVVGAVLTAMSITGTVFTNIVVSGLVIFLPRMIIFSVTEMLTSSLPLIDSRNFLSILNYRYNVPAGTIIGVMSYDKTVSDVMKYPANGIYTLVLGMVFVCLAAFLFHKRKSEQAGFSAPNKFVQAGIRILVAMVICLIPCQIIFETIVSDYDILTNRWIAVVIAYLIAVIVYFGYELVTTKKIKSLIRSIPGLGILGGLNVLFVVFLVVTYTQTLDFTPASSDIDYIYVAGGGAEYDDLKNYFDGQTEKIKLEDEEMIKIAAEQLAYTSDLWRRDYGEFYNQLDSNKMIFQCVGIKKGMSTQYRYILFPKDKYEVFIGKLGENDEVRKAYQELPDKGELRGKLYLSNGEYTEAEKILLYECIREDVQKLSFEQWYGIARDMMPDQDNSILEVLTIEMVVGDETQCLMLPIASNMKKTSTALLEIFDKRNEEFIKALKEDTSFDLDINFYNPENNYIQFYYDQELGEMEVFFNGMELNSKAARPEALISYLETSMNATLDTSKPYAFVHLYTYGNNDEGWKEYSGYFQISAEDLPKEFMNMQ